MPTPTILIADDDASIIALLRHLLKPFDCEILEAMDGEQALLIASERIPDVALLDVQMPKRSGWEVCQALKAVQKTSNISVVLITGRGDVRDRLTGLQLGADDYLVKPFRPEQVLKRIGALLTKRSEESLVPITRSSMSSVRNTVLNDPATGLATVPLVLDRVRERLIQNQEVGIVYVDVEQFELIEAEFGWAFFDEFLRTVASVLEQESRVFFGDCIVTSNRVGGSSFLVFFNPKEVEDHALEEGAKSLNEKLLLALHDRFPHMRSGEIGFFIGVSHIEYEPQIRLERQIYRGMQRAADAVRDAELQRRRSLMKELREIVRRRRITTVFQPIAWAHDLSIFGYEVLTRGPKQSSFRNSDMLFSFAREAHLLWDLEQLSLECAVDRLRKLESTNWKFLVNLEAEMFSNPDFHVHKLMEFFAEQKNNIVFELTERAAIEDYAAFRELLEEFRSKGIEIAIDDAGSGYASLEAIASLSPDYLKITKSLVSSLANEPIKQDLISMLVELARKTGAKTLAEGIETAEEYEWCCKLGIDLLQGYYIGRPSENFIHEVVLTEVEPAKVASSKA
jgi:EAL domain-containing protein (putative c-di-GMP-specific phosphodiesterase class I)/DNA-binding response OmpR family regulator